MFGFLLPLMSPSPRDETAFGLSGKAFGILSLGSGLWALGSVLPLLLIDMLLVLVLLLASHWVSGCGYSSPYLGVSFVLAVDLWVHLDTVFLGG